MDRAVSLFDYKIKNRDNFYDREYPVYHPIRQKSDYDSYWLGRWQKIIEGRWVYDEGTWMYLPPKMEFFLNVMPIVIQKQDKRGAVSRKLGKPDLWDVTFIIFNYGLCTLGFSGFSGDQEVSCNEVLGKVERGEEIFSFEEEVLESKYLRDPNGNLKKYVRAWDYLKTYYHTTRPLGVDLGIPLYQNSMTDGMLMGTRGGGKTFNAIADLMHEFITGGVKYWDQRSEIFTNTIVLNIAAASDNALSKYLGKMKQCWEGLPGGYSDNEMSKPSPFHRVLNKGLGNPWSISGKTPIKHSFIDQITGKEAGSDSTIYKNVPTVENPEGAVGDRLNLGQAEEVGFIKKAKKMHAANRDNVTIDGIRIGRNYYWGTSGVIDKIAEPEYLFTHPELEEIYGIPNYWENPSKLIGLHLPRYYLDSRFRDPQGNMKLQESYEFEENEIERLKNEGASLAKLTDRRLWNPNKPSHMFRSAVSSILPAEDASERLTELENYDLWKAKSHVGRFEFIDSRTVEWKPDLKHELEPILRLEEDLYSSKKGAVIIYEHPPANKPAPSFKNALYKIVYDPVKKATGTSLASILVYKGYTDTFWGDISWDENLMDSIVAEYIGRDEDDEDKNHEIAIALALYYNAKVLYENNERGFYTYCKHRGYLDIMQPTPWLGLGRERGPAEYGVPINATTKPLALRAYADWLKIKRGQDRDLRRVTNTHKLYSERMLREIEKFDYNEGNWDHVSAGLILGVWLKAEQQEPISETASKEKQDAFAGLANAMKRKPDPNYEKYYRVRG